MQFPNLYFEFLSEGLHDSKNIDSWTRLRKFYFVQVLGSEKPNFVVWQIVRFVKRQIICRTTNYLLFCERTLYLTNDNYSSNDKFFGPIYDTYFVSYVVTPCLMFFSKLENADRSIHEQQRCENLPTQTRYESDQVQTGILSGSPKSRR